jgi:EAL domain-containing protein (putative c-di-GMP-specific phosphodiesterase class I)
LPPALLELEITESVLMRDTDRALKVLSELRQIGIKVSIDDFGTRLFQPEYLKLPLDKLKIDQSFIRDLPRTPTMWRLRKPSLPSAQNSAWPSLPRVETGSKYEFLRNNGCNQIQAFISAARVRRRKSSMNSGRRIGRPDFRAEVCFQ